MRTSTIHKAGDGSIHPGTHQACMLCLGFVPCQFPGCLGMFKEPDPLSRETGWQFPINEPNDVPAHDHRTE